MTGPLRRERPRYPGALKSTFAELEHLLSYAILAPSSHNAQPWQFAIRTGEIEVWADPSRTLTHIDPDQRQLYMSCGAALYNLRVAMRAYGHADEVTCLPEPSQPHLLAVVRRGAALAPTGRDLEAYDAIARRRTHRGPFLPRPVSQDLAHELALSVEVEHAWLVRLHPFAKREVADAIASADRRMYSDEAYRAELAQWLVPRGDDRRDGVPMVKRDVATSLPGLGPLAVKYLDRGEVIAAHEAELATAAPMLAVLGTNRDDVRGWIAAGEALEAVFLCATARGLGLAFLNQVIEDPELREAIAREANYPGYPQLVLRFGYGEMAVATPRRALADVLR